MTNIQNPSVVAKAYARINQHLHKTPILQSETINELLNAEVYFKAEPLQKTGAFKVRGVLNHLLELQEMQSLPPKVVTYSTGNHGIGLAWVAKMLKIHARIYLPNNTTKIKQQAAKYYGAEVIYTNTRKEAESKAKNDSNNGFYYLHPSDSNSTIAGAGTILYEALQQLKFSPDAIFASCGGGGLLAGCYLAKELSSPTSLLIGCEPSKANDAFLSIKQGKIFEFSTSPETIADGLRTLALSERTFRYLQKLDDFMLADEDAIYYWTAWLIHLLKIVCEPSCALNMECAQRWLKKQNNRKRILILLSGGNIDPVLYREIWKEDYLLSAICDHNTYIS